MAPLTPPCHNNTFLLLLLNYFLVNWKSSTWNVREKRLQFITLPKVGTAINKVYCLPFSRNSIQFLKPTQTDSLLWFGQQKWHLRNIALSHQLQEEQLSTSTHCPVSLVRIWRDPCSNENVIMYNTYQIQFYGSLTYISLKTHRWQLLSIFDFTKPYIHPNHSWKWKEDRPRHYSPRTVCEFTLWWFIVLHPTLKCY